MAGFTLVMAVPLSTVTGLAASFEKENANKSVWSMCIHLHIAVVFAFTLNSMQPVNLGEVGNSHLVSQKYGSFLTHVWSGWIPQHYVALIVWKISSVGFMCFWFPGFV
jgi:hypothetical protein